LSDVYAMGGRPLTALSIAAFPEKDFPMEWGAAIFRGGLEKLKEAGCALMGGHTVRDPEIKFGYAVTGLVHPRRILTNAGARPGDVVVLTKALGTGVVATALKAGRAPEEAVQAATRSMSALSARAADAALRHGVRAATDVTGFGLAGHATTVARESHVTLEISAADLPVLPCALDLAPAYQPRGLRANRLQFEPGIDYRADVEEARRALLFDPQTSGGLLLFVPSGAIGSLLADIPHSRAIGAVRPRGPAPLVLV
jgi:selenide,water dikinase